MSKHRKHSQETSAEMPEAELHAESASVDEVAALRQELEAAEAKATDNWNQFLRATAELDNFRKRAERDMAAARKYGVERIAADLLAVRDSLEMGLVAAKTQGQEANAVADGMELTLKQLTVVMERYGISPVDPQGEAFNPELHQAMAMQESDDHSPNTIIQVMQKGYRLHDRLLRPAMVVVAKSSAAQTEELPPDSP